MLSDRLPLVFSGRFRVGTASTVARSATVALVGVALLLVFVVDPVVAGAALVTGVLNTAGGGGAVVTFLALVRRAACRRSPRTRAARSSRRCRFSADCPPRGSIGRTGGGCCPVGRARSAASRSSRSPEPGTFQAVAPWCLLPAAALVAMQGPVQRLVRTSGRPDRAHDHARRGVRLRCLRRTDRHRDRHPRRRRLRTGAGNRPHATGASVARPQRSADRHGRGRRRGVRRDRARRLAAGRATRPAGRRRRLARHQDPRPRPRLAAENRHRRDRTRRDRLAGHAVVTDTKG